MDETKRRSDRSAIVCARSMQALQAPPIFCEPQNRTRMLPKNWSSTVPWRLSELRQNPHAFFMIPHVNLQNSTHILLLAEAFGFAADVRKSKICTANYYKDL